MSTKEKKMKEKGEEKKEILGDYYILMLWTIMLCNNDKWWIIKI